jgi:tRNA/rRNA methyltransferase
MGENIGAAARVMLNFALSDLRLVAPRDGWPNEKAVAMASRAIEVIDNVQVFETTAEAVADLQHVYAATARSRDMVKPVVDPRRAAAALRAGMAKGERCGVMFGPERSGLENDDLVLADTVLTVPLNPGFSSLNLAQAVALVAYEWFTTGEPETPAGQLSGDVTRPANKHEMQGLFEHLETALEEAGYFDPVRAKKPAMVRNLRNMLQRANLLEQDVRTLRGVIKALARGQRPSRDKEQP